MNSTSEHSYPLYVSIEQAAKYAGISEHMMRAFANQKVDPIPHIRCGNKKLVRRDGIADYLKGKEFK